MNNPPPDSSSEPFGLIRQPCVRLVGRQSLDESALAQFLADEQAQWQTDTDAPAERLIELAGRMCYMSYGKGRKSNAEYIGHLLEVGHGSVLEHSVWNFLITGVSRSFTHELVRHRAGFSYSQLSQRYVDESQTDFVEPACIAEDPELHAVFLEAMRACHQAYAKLTDGLAKKFQDVEDRTLRRKMARQAARSVLPNATETKIFVTANGRALRHFIELRCSRHAETEIRTVAEQMLRILQKESPNVFGDYELVKLPDGTFEAQTPNRKV